MGRPKTPLERMAARSKGGNKTLGGRELAPVVTGAVVSGNDIPEPPSELHGRGAEEWAKVWLAGFWLKPDQDYAWVEMIAKAYEDIEVFRAQVKADGLVVTGYANQVVAHPLIAEIRKCEATIQKCLQVLGFSPTDRARLMITEAKAQNAVLDFLNKRK